ncbi:MAG: hypothetical protein AB1467_02840 [Candidatus Diapherotrites archaeon]
MKKPFKKIRDKKKIHKIREWAHGIGRLSTKGTWTRERRKLKREVKEKLESFSVPPSYPVIKGKAKDLYFSKGPVARRKRK